ncbi:MAG: hypothetical protein ACRC62_13150 [Microcoleus sp.]
MRKEDWTFFAVSGVIVAGIIAGLYFAPLYNIYSKEQEGRAALAKAEYSRKAQIEDAKAKLESAKYLKEAADLIESSLSPAYLEYLRIQMQEEVGSKNDSSVYFFDGKPPAVTTKK